MTTRKTIAFIRQTIVGKVMSLLFIYYFFIFYIYFFNFTILYWFCHISKRICHSYTCVPHPEPSSLLPPHSIPLGGGRGWDDFGEWH